MRNILKVILIVLVLLPISGWAAEEEEVLIRSAVEELYIKGLQSRDFTLIEKICLPSAVLMSGGKDEVLRVTTLNKWSQRFDPKNPPFKKLDYCLLNIDREGTAAQVKILFIVDGKNRVIDFLHMLKIEGAWRIANIIDF